MLRSGDTEVGQGKKKPQMCSYIFFFCRIPGELTFNCASECSGLDRVGCRDVYNLSDRLTARISCPVRRSRRVPRTRQLLWVRNVIITDRSDEKNYKNKTRGVVNRNYLLKQSLYTFMCEITNRTRLWDLTYLQDNVMLMPFFQDCVLSRGMMGIPSWPSNLRKEKKKNRLGLSLLFLLSTLIIKIEWCDMTSYCKM